MSKQTKEVKVITTTTFQRLKKGRFNYLATGEPDVVLREPDSESKKPSAKNPRGTVSFMASQIISCKNGDFLAFGKDGDNLLIGLTDESDKDGLRISGTNSFGFSSSSLTSQIAAGRYRANGKKQKQDGIIFDVFEPIKTEKTTKEPLSKRGNLKS